MKWTGFTLIVTLLLGAALMLLSPYRALTPGTLRPGHAVQRNACFSCHTLLAGTPAEKCGACHKPGEVGARSVKGLPLPKPNPRTQLIHQVIGGECARCHSEHSDPARTRATRKFPHDLLPAQVAKGCAACHAAQKPSDAIHATGTAECSQCHGSKGWKPATFEHERFFRLDKNHPPQCTDCHPPSASLKEYTCTSCHEHSPDRMAAKHRKEGITLIDKCRKCHPTGNEHDTISEGRPGGGRGRGDDHD